MVNFSLKIAGFVLLLPVLLCISEASAANIQAELDRGTVSINESFTLVFTTEGEEDGAPDFSPLEQLFEIHSQNESSRMSFINGEITRIKQWNLTLMGKEIGFFTIPSIHFGADKSTSLRIDITAAPVAKAGAEAEPVFLEVSATPETVYVQAQVIYTLRLYFSVNLLSAKLSEPILSDTDAVIEKLGKDREFETTVSNKRYRVIERRYAIFPQRSGQFTIAPVSFAGQLASRSRSNFNPFPGGGAIKRLRSRALQLDVKPVPQDKIRGRWLPAKKLRLVEVWPGNTGEKGEMPIAGEPLTWTITLMADGLTAAQLPEIEPKLPAGIKSYPEQALLNNEKQENSVIGIRQEKIDLIPGKAGSYRLPAIEIPWWNTITETMEVARLPARQIEVAPAEKAAQGASPTPLAPSQNRMDADSNIVASGNAAENAGFWSWISLILGLGWVITLIAWWGSRQKATADLASVSELIGPDIKQLNRQLKLACEKNDAAEAKASLLAWAQALWPGQAPNLGELKKQLGETLASEIDCLNVSLYGQHSKDWEGGDTLWAAFKQHQNNTKKKSTIKREGLSPMIPEY